MQHHTVEPKASGPLQLLDQDRARALAELVVGAGEVEQVGGVSEAPAVHTVRPGSQPEPHRLVRWRGGGGPAAGWSQEELHGLAGAAAATSTARQTPPAADR